MSINEGTSNINKDWGDSGIGYGFPNDNFSVRWQRNVTFSAGRYRFHIKVDDGGRLFVNNQKVIDQWKDQGATEYTVDLDLSSSTIPISFEYYDSGGGAVAQLWWELLQAPVTAPTLNSPANNNTINRTDSITLSWNTASGATQYYAEFLGGPNININSGWTANTSWALGSQWGGTYQWRVKARNSSGQESGWSETRILNIRTGTPTNLSGTVLSSDQIKLTWSASSDAPGNIDGYRIYRNGSAVATVTSSTTMYQNNGLACNTDYSFYVKAYKGSIESNASNTITRKTQACPPPPSSINLLDNSEFENGSGYPTSWSQDAWQPANSTFTWDTAQKHSGNRSVKIVNNPANDARWIQTVSVAPNTDYRLSGWIKTQDVQINGERGANISILDTWIGTVSLNGTKDWTYVFVDFNSEDRTSIRVAARLGMYSGEISGTAWFDDLKLEPMNVTIGTPLFTSIASHDGHILESTETSNKGGTQNSKASTFFLGDDAANKQYRAILSFNTTLPSNAIITKITLKIKYAGKAGTNPFSTHGNLLVDVRKGAFSNKSALQLGDFNAAASKTNIGNIPKAMTNKWHTKVWTSGIFDYINTSGVTQFRLRFAKDDNNDFGADYLKIYSGNASAANRPQLIIEYYVP